MMVFLVALLTQFLGETDLKSTCLRAIQYLHAHIFKCVVSENDISVLEVLLNLSQWRQSDEASGHVFTFVQIRINIALS
jgi:hypothetical protein